MYAIYSGRIRMLDVLERFLFTPGVADMVSVSVRVCVTVTVTVTWYGGAPAE